MIPQANPHTVKIHFITLDFENLEQTDRRTDTTCEHSDHYRPCVSRSNRFKYLQYSPSEFNLTHQAPLLTL